MNLEQLRRAAIDTDFAFEQQVNTRAARMSLDEVNAELARLPASPDTSEDVLARSAFTARRIALIEASKPSPLDPPADPAGMIDVFVPDGVDVGCVQDSRLLRKYYYARETADGRRIISMPAYMFFAIAKSTAGSSPVNGQAWFVANPALVDRLPKNPAPPPAEAPR